jgi:hypothetical protein
MVALVDGIARYISGKRIGRCEALGILSIIKQRLLDEMIMLKCLLLSLARKRIKLRF